MSWSTIIYRQASFLIPSLLSQQSTPTNASKRIVRPLALSILSKRVSYNTSRPGQMLVRGSTQVFDTNDRSNYKPVGLRPSLSPGLVANIIVPRTWWTPLIIYLLCYRTQSTHTHTHTQIKSAQKEKKRKKNN